MASFSTLPNEIRNMISDLCLAKTLLQGPKALNFAAKATKKPLSSHDAHIALAAKLSPTFPFLATNSQTINSALQPCLEACKPLFSSKKDVTTFASHCRAIDFDTTTRISKVALDLTCQTPKGADQLLSAVKTHFPATKVLELRITILRLGFYLPTLAAEEIEVYCPVLAGLIEGLEDTCAFPEMPVLKIRDLEFEKREKEVRRTGVRRAECSGTVQVNGANLKLIGNCLREAREVGERWIG